MIRKTIISCTLLVAVLIVGTGNVFCSNSEKLTFDNYVLPYVEEDSCKDTVNYEECILIDSIWSGDNCDLSLCSLCIKDSCLFVRFKVEDHAHKYYWEVFSQGSQIVSTNDEEGTAIIKVCSTGFLRVGVFSQEFTPSGDIIYCCQRTIPIFECEEEPLCLNIAPDKALCIGLTCSCEEEMTQFTINDCSGDPFDPGEEYSICHVDWTIDSTSPLSWACCSDTVIKGTKRDYDITSPYVFPCSYGDYEVTAEICLTSQCGDTIMIEKVYEGEVGECECQISDPDSHGGEGDEQGFKTRPDEDNSSDYFNVDIRPNPVQNNSFLVTIYSDMEFSGALKIYGVDGKQVDAVLPNAKIREGKNSFSIQSTKLESRTYYFLSVERSGRIVRTLKFLKQ